MEILLKSTISIEFLANRPKLCINCALPQNFHTRKLGEIKVFYAALFFDNFWVIHQQMSIEVLEKRLAKFSEALVNQCFRQNSFHGSFRNFSVKNPCWSSFKVHLHSFQGVFQRGLENTLFEKVCVGILLFQNFRSINYSL